MSGKNSHAGYDPAYFAPLAQAEDRHFWFRLRNKMITAAAMQAVGQLQPGYRVLEVGCGTGNVLRTLANLPDAGQVFGMDLYRDGLRFARLRTQCALVQADLRKHPFGVPFDLVGIFDVLEHLENDHGVLDQLNELISPGGWLLLTVPASRRLWSIYDEAGGHVRRYERHDLEELLIDAGFEIHYITHMMLSLFFPVWISRSTAALRRRIIDDSPETIHREALDEIRVLPVINELAAASLAWEVGMIKRKKRLPFGTSLLALVKKKN